MVRYIKKVVALIQHHTIATSDLIKYGNSQQVDLKENLTALDRESTFSFRLYVGLLKRDAWWKSRTQFGDPGLPESVRTRDPLSPRELWDQWDLQVPTCGLSGTLRTLGRSKFTAAAISLWLF